MKDYRYTVRIPPDTAAALVSLAEAHGRSLNREIVRALQAWTDVASTEDTGALVDPRSQPETRQLLDRLTDPTVRGFLRSAVEEAEAWARLSAASFARDWDSEEDRVYDDVP